MGCTAPNVPLSPDRRPQFQLRSLLRQIGRIPHSWAGDEEFCHTCKWGTDAVSWIPKRRHWRGWTSCWTQCMRECNAAQTAGTGEEMTSRAVEMTRIISALTLMDKQIYLRGGFFFLLSRSKLNHTYSCEVGHLFYSTRVIPEELEWKPKWGVCQTPKGGVRMQMKRSLCLWKTLLKESLCWRGFLFARAELH